MKRSCARILLNEFDWFNSFDVSLNWFRLDFKMTIQDIKRRKGIR